MTINGNLKNQEVIWQNYPKMRSIHRSLGAAIEHADLVLADEGAEPQVYIGIEMYSDLFLYLTINGTFKSITGFSRAVRLALTESNIPEIKEGQQLRFIGNSNSSCRNPFDEWYIIGVRTDSKLGPRVTLKFSESPNPQTDNPAVQITVASFKLPGYLVHGKEPATIVGKRIEQQKARAGMHERPRDVLVGPKNLSLCGDPEEGEDND
mgnify:CR=1 FL=1